MRILLIATNRHQRLMSRMNARPVPIGLAYIAGHLDPDQHELKVLDLMFSEDYLAETERTVKEFQPDLVGISCETWTIPATWTPSGPCLQPKKSSNASGLSRRQ